MWVSISIAILAWWHLGSGEGKEGLISSNFSASAKMHLGPTRPACFEGTPRSLLVGGVVTKHNRNYNVM